MGRGVPCGEARSAERATWVPGWWRPTVYLALHKRTIDKMLDERVELGKTIEDAVL